MENNVAITTGLTDLLGSERGWIFIIVMFCATVLAALGVLTKNDWVNIAQLFGLALIGSKTVTTAVETVSTKKGQAQQSPAPAASTTTPDVP